MGVHGMDPRSGFTTPNLLEAETDRALIEAGRRLVVVADNTKWGVIGISSIARFDEADVLITDSAIDPEARTILGGQVRELVVVEPALDGGGRFHGAYSGGPSADRRAAGRAAVSARSATAALGAE